MKASECTITFQFGPGDRSVGIFGENFCAGVVDGTVWCDLADYADDFKGCRFVWYDNESGLETLRPMYADIVEHALHGYALGMYANDASFFERLEASAAECGSNPDLINAAELISEDRPLSK